MSVTYHTTKPHLLKAFFSRQTAFFLVLHLLHCVGTVTKPWKIEAGCQSAMNSSLSVLKQAFLPKYVLTMETHNKDSMKKSFRPYLSLGLHPRTYLPMGE